MNRIASSMGAVIMAASALFGDEDICMIVGSSPSSQQYVNTTVTLKILLVEFADVKHRTDLMGREIATLVNADQAAGYHTATWNASGFGSGMYFYRLTVIPESGKPYSETRKLLLMK